ncbi:uncharacterized protein LOC115626750 [Scaptodrosophila lebanonensis]|uniref:Uncharacterized protein LOC115626750 n=1 Tax=Drosophila lebanonensis TaxID=7225 RepID=A0A6J2TT17_DROLE|nr:uncharacterized protein LOC115626750 [Scaptodrosophila lebanonensis]
MKLLVLPLIALIAYTSIAQAAKSKPQSFYCKRFQASVDNTEHFCEQHLVFTHKKCQFNCSDNNFLNITNCDWKWTGKDTYPLCKDLYCEKSPTGPIPDLTSEEDEVV